MQARPAHGPRERLPRVVVTGVETASLGRDGASSPVQAERSSANRL